MQWAPSCLSSCLQIINYTQRSCVVHLHFTVGVLINITLNVAGKWWVRKEFFWFQEQTVKSDCCSSCLRSVKVLLHLNAIVAVGVITANVPHDVRMSDKTLASHRNIENAAPESWSTWQIFQYKLILYIYLKAFNVYHGEVFL